LKFFRCEVFDFFHLSLLGFHVSVSHPGRGVLS
jgi:2,3-bisphosphoglycerate-independent phosphoglycerate mutase